MFHGGLKLLPLLVLWLGAVSAQEPTPPPAGDPPQEEGATPEPERPPLPPLPYELGVPHTYRWEHEGSRIGSTSVRIESTPDEAGPPRVRVHGTLTYERAGRVLTGTSTATYEGGIDRPTAYRRTLTVAAPGLGGAESALDLAIEGSRVTVTRREGVPQLRRSEHTVPEPIWLLDDQCFEHWVILAPYFPRILDEGRLEVFVPHAETVETYTIRKERTEGEGPERRERWALRHRTFEAKLWTDAEGRVVEYLQGEVRIVLETPAPAHPEPANGAGGEAERD